MHLYSYLTVLRCWQSRREVCGLLSVVRAIIVTRAWSVEMARKSVARVGVDGRSSLVSVLQFHVGRLVELAVVRRLASRAGARLLYNITDTAQRN